MQLFFRKKGEGKPLIILHGLLGSSDNWQSFANIVSEKGYAIYLVDQRNHGQSPHSDVFNYQSMSDDLGELISSNGIADPVILGHSMGAKTTMHFALQHPEVPSAIIAVDMAPRKYPPSQKPIIEALKAVPLDQVKSRGEVEEFLRQGIPDQVTRQFVLKSLYWKEKDQLGWRFNLDAIGRFLENTGEETRGDRPFTKPALFIRGENSNYITVQDEPGIRSLFPNAIIKTAPGAGHWVHADNLQWMVDACLEFLGSIQ